MFCLLLMPLSIMASRLTMVGNIIITNSFHTVDSTTMSTLVLPRTTGAWEGGTCKACGQVQMVLMTKS